MADEAAAVLASIAQSFSSQWEAETWQSVMSGPFSYLFELPKSQFAADEDATAVVGLLYAASDATLRIANVDHLLGQALRKPQPQLQYCLL